MAGRKTAAEKARDEVREQQIETHHDNVTNVPGPSVEEAIGTTPSGKKDKTLGFQLIDAKTVIVTIDDKEVLRVNAEQYRSIQRAVNAIGGSVA